MDNNKLVEFLEDVMYFRKHNDEEGMLALLHEGEQESVTLKDVALSILDVIDDLTGYIDASVAASQALTEERLRAIVSSLELNTKQRITLKFNEAEDDMFSPEEENSNDTK